ncbi:DUF1998 domain-containing protein [Vagococcus fluvialis]|uniref:DUF1998 domain-containing protein n=1 Tax=Vagococcus fluvialis TaxID=2738 RepID=UPI001A8E9FC3|nr:DUF1998 domain-containing protein [Vagococcus fluvialis]MBO0429995.1 DUF1998 domain-containing protein [Vagococcus fluvialis]
MNREIGRGKLIGQQGPGSIYVDTDGSSYLISSADKWYDREIKNSYIDKRDFELRDSRLEKILMVDKFLEVPDYRTTFDKSNAKNTKLSIPIARFPLLEYCSKCGTFRKAKPTYSNRKRRCFHCEEKQNFIQFPIVVMCKEGHISDFPHFRYIHVKKENMDSCSRQWIDRTGPSLLNWTLRCNCGANHSLTGVTGKSSNDKGTPFMNEMHGAKCYGEMPWTGSDIKADCENFPMAVLKNSLNVYRPDVVEALSFSDSEDRNNYNITFEELLHEEFTMLKGKADTEKLKVELSFDSYSKDKVIRSVNYVRRLEQLVVQTNFHREEHIEEVESFERSQEGTQVSNLFSPEYTDRRWYPAKRVYGEGIFIEINSKLTADWEKKEELTSHYSKLEARVGEFYLREKFDSPSAILMHTLSHALIKELSKQSGYPITSIRERLYLSDNEKGILLYVTDSDKAGTYGGLVRLAKKEKFEEIMSTALNNMEWCSSDPVCFELGDSFGQGVQNSNGAACHNCSFVPSTSCSYRNCFLDRDYLSRIDSDVKITNWYDMM